MPVHDWTLVDAGIFDDFHAEWIISLKHALNQGVLPPDHYALAEQISGGLHPDVLAPVAVGKSLPDMPLFLKSETYVEVPLEVAYAAAFEAVPRRWRSVLDKQPS